MILPILGAAFLVFRVWLVQFKLADELEFRKDYVSRALSLYFCIAMVLGFENEIFNLIVASSLPVLIVAFFGWDLPFFFKFKYRTYWKKNQILLLIERVTLHPPILITGGYWIATGFKSYVDLKGGITSVIAAVILVFGPFILWDKRVTERYEHPTGLNMFVGAVISLILVLIYIYYF